MLIANILLAVLLSVLLILLAVSMVALLFALGNQVLLLLFSGAARLKSFKPNPALRKWLRSDAAVLPEPKPSAKIAP